MKDINIGVRIQQDIDYFTVTVCVKGTDNDSTLYEKIQGQCIVIENGYIINNVYVNEYTLVKGVMNSNEAYTLLKYLYKVGDIVLYRSTTNAKPVFGIVEAGNFSEDYIFVRLEFNEAYYINVEELEKIGYRYE